MADVVAVAVLHGAPPRVFVADDAATLHRLLALELVAQTRAVDLTADVVSDLRTALLDERWGDAVELWIRSTDERLDVYESWDLVEAADVELTTSELQFRRLFEGP